MGIYDSLAPFYDLLSASERPFRRRALDLLALSAADRVVEIGCGTGWDLARAAEPVGEGMALGLDLSVGMLRTARGRLKTKPQAHLLRADAAALPLCSGAFTAAFCSFTLEALPGEAAGQALREVRRVLAPGGRAALVCLYKPDRPGRAARVYAWFHRRLPRLVDCAPLRAAELLTGAGFAVRSREVGLLWGLPVEIVLGVKGG